MCDNNCKNVLWSPKYFHLNRVTLVLEPNVLLSESVTTLVLPYHMGGGGVAFLPSPIASHLQVIAVIQLYVITR